MMGVGEGKLFHGALEAKVFTVSVLYAQMQLFRLKLRVDSG